MTNASVHTLYEKKKENHANISDSKAYNKTLYSLIFFLLKQVYWVWFPFKEETSHSATLSVILKKKKKVWIKNKKYEGVGTLYDGN